MSGGYAVDIAALHEAGKGIVKSCGDLEVILRTVSSGPLDIPQLACTQTDLLENDPSATAAYAQARGDAEAFLRTMVSRLADVVDALDTVAQHYQQAEAANTAAASSAQP
jgi:hypothetical protein